METHALALGITMDADLKQKWVAVLRSGEFKQGESKLHNPKEDSFCCLGVLCKIMGAEWTTASYETEDENEFGEEIIVSNDVDHVPVLKGKMLSKADDEELNDDFLSEVGIPDQGVLIEMNDGKGSKQSPDYLAPKPFSEIADYIEKHL